jgi:hypothetical protein
VHGCLECIRRRQRVEICILTGAAGGDALGAVFFAEIVHAVEGAADLEAEDHLGVLALEPDLVAESLAEIDREDEGGLRYDVLKAFLRFEDEGDVVGVGIGGEEMVWEAALDEGVWGLGRVLDDGSW